MWVDLCSSALPCHFQNTIPATLWCLAWSDCSQHCSETGENRSVWRIKSMREQRKIYSRLVDSAVWRRDWELSQLEVTSESGPDVDSWGRSWWPHVTLSTCLSVAEKLFDIRGWLTQHWCRATSSCCVFMWWATISGESRPGCVDIKEESCPDTVTVTCKSHSYKHITASIIFCIIRTEMWNWTLTVRNNFEDQLREIILHKFKETETCWSKLTTVTGQLCLTTCTPEDNPSLMKMKRRVN